MIRHDTKIVLAAGAERAGRRTARWRRCSACSEACSVPRGHGPRRGFAPRKGRCHVTRLRRLRGMSMWGGSEAAPRARNGPPRRRHLLHLRLETPRIRFTDRPGKSFCSGEEKIDNRTSSSQSLHCNHGLNQSIAFSANVHDGHRAHAEAHLPPWPFPQTWPR